MFCVLSLKRRARHQLRLARRRSRQELGRQMLLCCYILNSENQITIMRTRILRLLHEWRIENARQLLSGSDAWSVLDRLSIPGFGIHPIRLFFPHVPARESLWGFGRPPHRAIEARLASGWERYRPLLQEIDAVGDRLSTWPRTPDPNAPSAPHLKNQFYPLVDAVVLYGLLQHFRPQKYLEIGSGISTQIARRAREDSSLPMQIVSVDPEPRQEIDAICDSVIRQRFEDTDPQVWKTLQPGDVLFFDGSHYCLPGNDVIYFFLKVLWELPPGVIVHVHDIYWPEDYAPEMLKFLWSEQYLLGAWLLGGTEGFEILFPCAYLSQHSELAEIVARLKASLADPDITSSLWHERGTSFWLKKT